MIGEAEEELEAQVVRDGPGSDEILRRQGEGNSSNCFRSDTTQLRVKGTVPVKDMLCGPCTSIGSQYKYNFQIETPGRTYYMYADTEEAWRLWRQKLVEMGGKWKEELALKRTITDKGIILVRQTNGEFVEEKEEEGGVDSDEEMPDNGEKERKSVIKLEDKKSQKAEDKDTDTSVPTTDPAVEPKQEDTHVEPSKQKESPITEEKASSTAVKTGVTIEPGHFKLKGMSDD